MVSFLACRAFSGGTLGERVRFLSTDELEVSLKSINTTLPHASAQSILHDCASLFF